MPPNILCKKLVNINVDPIRAVVSAYRKPCEEKGPPLLKEMKSTHTIYNVIRHILHNKDQLHRLMANTKKGYRKPAILM